LIFQKVYSADVRSSLFDSTVSHLYAKSTL
jgi:hypothetical protein